MDDSVPEFSEWRDSGNEWVAPAELSTPSENPEYNLAIKLLASGRLHVKAVELVGRFIAEQARFQIWYHDNVKSSGLRLDEAAALLLVPMEQTRVVYEAWKNFEQSFGSDLCPGDARQQIRARSAELMEALEAAVAALSKFRRDP